MNSPTIILRKCWIYNGIKKENSWGKIKRSSKYAPWWSTTNFLKRKSVVLTHKVRVMKSLCRASLVKNLPAGAGGTGLTPGLGGFHMLRGSRAQHHSYWARALGPGAAGAEVWAFWKTLLSNKRRHATAVRSLNTGTGRPCSPCLEQAQGQQQRKTWCSQKIY